MGTSFVKSMVIQLLNALVNMFILGPLGPFLVAHQLTTTEAWTAPSAILGWLIVATIWMYIGPTKWVRELSGTVSQEDIDRMIRVGISMPEDATVEQVKAVAADLKTVNQNK